MGGVPSAAQPPSYSPVPSAAGRPFPSASPSSFATSRAQSQAQSGTSRSSTPLSLPAFESFGDGSLEGFDWRRKSDDLGGSIKETDEGLDAATGGGLGGLITPKPGMDDSELGYLAAGGGANDQDGASEREPRNRVQSGMSGVSHSSSLRARLTSLDDLSPSRCQLGLLGRQLLLYFQLEVLASQQHQEPSHEDAEREQLAERRRLWTW